MHRIPVWSPPLTRFFHALLVVLCVGALPAHAQLVAPAGGACSTPVERWDYLELELKGPTAGNPFTDVALHARFTDGTTTVETPGFYDGEGVYRIRFMPPRPGRWTYETFANRWELTGKLGEFTVTPASEGNHGPVRVRATYHFAHEDGTPFKPVGTTIYSWLDAPEDWQELTLRTLASSPFNKARMLVTPQQNRFRDTFAPPRWPYEGTPPRDWDLARFNPDFFRHHERRLLQLRALGIEADLILFHPYGKAWGLDTLTPAQDERYLRYIVARFSALRNVWWSLANEHDFIRTKTDADWDRLFQIVRDADPYGHLRSIHNGKLIYNHTHPWVTHASIQHQAAPRTPAAAQLFRDVYRKPVVYDEVEYEGDFTARWGRLSPEEMVHRFWCGTVAGTYVSHGDIYKTPEKDAWISFGGELGGTSAPRLAFLRRILEEGPRDGLDPVDKWWDPDTAGVGGRHYLVYFGHDTPREWAFRLFRAGVADGQRYRVEIIDTWAMTITPVAGEFVTKRQDNYHYREAAGRAVALPGRAGMALRITRLDEAPAAPPARQPED